MARYTGAKLRITRRLGDLPGLTSKKGNLTARPGQHGATQKKLTQYAIRLEEKQKLRFNYGLSEKQLMNYIKQAKTIKGATGTILLQLLEMRLDTICFNLGFGTTIAQARQFVNHGHITVNNEVVDIASFQCRIGDKIGVKQNSNSIKLIGENLKINQKPELPSHLTLTTEKIEGEILNHCSREDLLLELNELLVIEYYSRR